jgi:2'-hydroxybiphenyl-2-sulfinate desulfinase
MSHKISEILYSICPVGNSSYLAANGGFLQKGLDRYGVKATSLKTLPPEKRHIHYTYEDNAFFREGGNIPPIWAKSRGAEPILIGLTFVEQRTYILARLDSPIDRLEELRGKRAAISVYPKTLVDWYAATVRRGFKSALEARGLTLSEVTFVEVDETEEREKQWGGLDLAVSAIRALDAGEVDAIYVDLAPAQRLLNTGKYKVLYNLHANTDVVPPIHNVYPDILTVSRKLAEDAPEIVVEYIKQTLLAAEWAKSHLKEAAGLLAKQLDATVGETVNIYPSGFNQRLELTLDEKGLWALESQKRFLLDNGYIEKDFDLGAWMDDSFLKAAHSLIEAEKAA